MNETDLERRVRNLQAIARHRSSAATNTGSPESAEPSRWKRLLALLGPVGLLLVFLLSKLKLIVPLLKMTKLGTFVSMIVAVWAYAWLWGLPFAVGFVLLIFLHELGHAIVLRQQGIPAGAPVFIPFVGAFIAMKGRPRDAWVEALVGIGGPVLGGVAALACLFVGLATGSLFWYALASTGFLLNLFNMIPISPLDGGRILGVVSPWLWAAGYAVGIAVLLVTHSPILFLILLLGVFEVVRAVRAVRERYYDVAPGRRVAMGAAYFVLLAGLTLGMWIADRELATLHVAEPSLASGASTQHR